MKKRGSKKLSFTTENVISSFSEVTGISADRLSTDEEVEPSELLCTLCIEGPVIGDWKLEEVTIYRDQKALDKRSADDMRDDEISDHFNLSNEDVVRYASKGFILSDLNHWIIAEGRHSRLSDAEIEAQLKRPLETLIEHYGDDDMEGAFTTLVRQCRSDTSEMAKHLIRAAGGSQNIWKDELFEELPGGFIVHIIADEEISLFRQLVEEVKKAREKK
jgi:hypothetical protein